jgi:hypothetical protein
MSKQNAASLGRIVLRLLENIDVAHGTGVILCYAHNVINCVQNITKAASHFKRSHCGNNVVFVLLKNNSFHVEKIVIKI